MRCNGCDVELPESFPAWRKSCSACFRRAKQDEVIELRRMLQEADVRAFQEETRLKRLLLEAVLRMKQTGTTADAFAEMDRAMVTRILTLCHPDRHGNSAVSNDVSRYLIELRAKLPSR